jgi:hypothetical protein
MFPQPKEPILFRDIRSLHSEFWPSLQEINARRMRVLRCDVCGKEQSYGVLDCEPDGRAWSDGWKLVHAGCTSCPECQGVAEKIPRLGQLT